MSEKITPLYDRVIVEPSEKERKTASGIVIPTNAQEKPIEGKIVRVGRGKRLENGDFAALTVKVGDTVIFGKYAGTEVKINGKELMVMREDDILAIIK